MRRAQKTIIVVAKKSANQDWRIEQNVKARSKGAKVIMYVGKKVLVSLEEQFPLLL